MGLLLTPRQGLAELVASSAKFRTITGAANAAAALEFAHYPFPEPTDVRPWALIDNGEGTQVEEQVRFSVNGSLVLTLEVPEDYYSAQTGDKAKWIAFAGDVDTIIEQIMTNSNAAKGDGTNYWNLIAVELLQQPYRTLEQNGDVEEVYFSVMLLCRWV